MSGRTPLALPNSRYGINFMIMMVILRLHGMSNQRIREIVLIMYSTRITESAINRMVCRMARELGPLYEKIQGGGKKLACDKRGRDGLARRRHELLAVDGGKQVLCNLRGAPPQELEGSKKDARQGLSRMRDV